MSFDTAGNADVDYAAVQPVWTADSSLTFSVKDLKNRNSMQLTSLNRMLVPVCTYFHSPIHASHLTQTDLIIARIVLYCVVLCFVVLYCVVLRCMYVSNVHVHASVLRISLSDRLIVLL